MAPKARSTSHDTSSTTYPSKETTTLSRLGTGRPSTSRPKTRAKTATSTTGGSRGQQLICAISESRGTSPTIGLAFVNISTMEALLCQIVDSQTYARTLHKLHVFEPTEILIPNTAAVPNKSKLLQVLQATLEIDAPINPISRKYWDESVGVEYIQQLAFRQNVEAIKVSIAGNYFATCCLAAALRYIELSLSISFAHHSMRMKYEPADGSMMIDLSTIRSLELIQNLTDPKSKDCLFSLLNQTLTPMGSRLLRSNVLQPLTERKTLEERYDALQELTTSEEIFSAVRHALKPFLDVDRVLTEFVILPNQPSLQRWEQSINNVILLKQFVRSIQPVFEALEGVRSTVLQRIRQYCRPVMFLDVSDLIDESINEEVTYQKKPIDLRNQRTYAIKAGVNGLLDVARQTYKEATNDVYQLVNELGESHGLSLDLKYDNGRQFYIVLPSSELEDRNLPAIFINHFRRKNLIECQTLDLVKLNQKIADSHHEVLQMSDSAVQQLIERIRTEVSVLFNISESIAMLDMISSLAQVATMQDYCRPELTSTLAIRSGRHPLHEKVHDDKFIPNDVYATEQTRLQIITGCNMSGKSTYIRSIALMTIMAQVGSFVPAAYASFSIRHQLFARVSLDDSSTSNISTFAAEMRETAFILQNIDSRSLVIVDELGRGTLTRDGLSIAIAVVEALVQSRALVWFVTHFCDLATFLGERPGIVNLHLVVEMRDQDRMLMLYKIAQGPVTETHYGIALAKVVGLPPEVLDIAEGVSQKLTKIKEDSKKTAKGVIQARRGRLVLGLKEQLIQTKEGNMQGEVLRSWLRKLQDEFVIRMSKLEDEEMGAYEVGDEILDSTATYSSMLGEAQEVQLTSITDSSSEPTTANREIYEDAKTMISSSILNYTAPTLVRSPTPDARRDGRYTMSGALGDLSVESRA